MGRDEVQKKSEYGTILGTLHGATVVRGADDKVFVVPQAFTSLSKQELMDMVNLLGTIEAFTR